MEETPKVDNLENTTSEEYDTAKKEQKDGKRSIEIVVHQRTVVWDDTPSDAILRPSAPLWKPRKSYSLSQCAEILHMATRCPIIRQTLNKRLLAIYLSLTTSVNIDACARKFNSLFKMQMREAMIGAFPGVGVATQEYLGRSVASSHPHKALQALFRRTYHATEKHMRASLDGVALLCQRLLKLKCLEPRVLSLLAATCVLGEREALQHRDISACAKGLGCLSGLGCDVLCVALMYCTTYELYRLALTSRAMHKMLRSDAMRGKFMYAVGGNLTLLTREWMTGTWPSVRVIASSALIQLMSAPISAQNKYKDNCSPALCVYKFVHDYDDDAEDDDDDDVGSSDAAVDPITLQLDVSSPSVFRSHCHSHSSSSASSSSATSSEATIDASWMPPTFPNLT